MSWIHGENGRQLAVRSVRSIWSGCRRIGGRPAGTVSERAVQKGTTSRTLHDEAELAEQEVGNEADGRGLRTLSRGSLPTAGLLVNCRHKSTSMLVPL